MADRTVRVVLQAVTQQFDAALQKAAGSAKALQSNMEKVNKGGGFNDLTKAAATVQPKLAEIAASVDKTTAVSNTAMGKLAHTVRENGDALSTVGRAATTVGAAWTAINAAVAATGISYNTLQQTSRAALTTLTGSAEAANAQMDKLDAFARTSPFAKDVFITAQQQMLGFGIEAGKVIPYLSAINDATAAMGGNNHTVAELTRIMAQISASAKITATDLREFGNRGIDAATIIGSQMGKTGAQIRDDITAGTLDAQVALDALAAGMSERFEGASANVKNTMAGAFDRVKAAWRDLSAAIMEPAVSQSGGGFLVDLTNSVADFIRGVEALPNPVKQGAAAVGAIAGAATLAAGGLMTLVPKMLEAHAAFKTLSSAFPGIGAKAGIAGLAIAGATTVIGLAVSEMGKHAAAVDEYVAILQGAGDDSEKQIRQFHAQRLAAEGVGDELERMGLNARLAVDATMGDLEAREKIIDAYNREADAKRAAAEASDAGGEMAAFEQAQITSLETRRDRILALIEAERALAAESQETAEQQRQMVMTSEEGQRAWGEAVKAYHTEGRGEIASTTSSIRELTEAEKKWLDTVVGASSGFIDHFDALEAAQQQYAERAAVAAGESADAWKDFAESGKFSLLDFAAALQEQVDAMNEWETNIIALHGKVGQSSIDALMEMANTNPQLAAQLAAEMVTATTDTLSKLEPNLERVGDKSGKALHDSLTASVRDLDLAAVMGAAGAKGGDAMMLEAAAKFQAGEATLGQIIADYDLYAELGIDTSMFLQGTAEAKADAEADPATITIEADDDPASQTVGSLLDEIDNSTGTTTVEADTGPASQEVTDILAWVERQRADVTVGADTSAAERAARAALNRISSMTANMSVTARVGVYHRNGFNAPMAQGGKVGDAVAAYQGMSDGGRVYGPGTTTSDEAALVSLSHGEFVIREWAARMIGYDQLEHANNTGRLPTEHRMQATPAAYTVNYSMPSQGQQAAPQVTNHYTVQMPSASLRDVATVAEFFEHPELHAHHAGGTR